MGIRYAELLNRAEVRGRLWLFPLTLLSFLYGWIATIRLALYRWGLLKQKRLIPRVISIGNLTAGGTGKTPLVRACANQLTDLGEKVVILSRGYKRRVGKHPFTVVSTGEGPLVSWQEAGEEPYWLAEQCKNVPVLVGKDRYRAGRYAVEQFHPSVVLLDDGFQHLRLERDLDLLLIDGTQPFGNRYLLPRGWLREPLSHMRRAHGIILTKVDQAENLEAIKNEIRLLAEHRPLFQTRLRPVEFRSVAGGMKRALDMITGKSVLAVSGIGNPSAFHKMLHGLQAKEVVEKVFPDHFSYGPEGVADLLAAGSSVDFVITTEKDGVKLAPLLKENDSIWALRVEVEFLEPKEWSNFIVRKGTGAPVASKKN